MTAPPVIPDHELLRRIGRGAYGEVWLAKSLTGAFRAVKIVYRSTFEHDRPFQREFQGILSFEPISRRHDSQVDILHVGRGEDYFYYVMELADDQATGGQILPDQYAPRTLKSEMMFRSRLPFEECVSIAITLTTALQHLHENGLVHRDVKPSNIIFVNGVPKLADIGLVTGVDATRSYVGTEGFAAPEGPGTPQADLYSLGKVLYEIATGRDRQDFPELPTGIPEMPDRDGLIELNAVIARACRHNPKERYRSAAEMRADLELLQSGKSLARLHRTERRLRFVQRAGAAVTALAALIAVGWIWQARQTRLAKELVEEKTRLSQERSSIAEQNRESLVRLRVANGVRLWDEGDAAGALLWFAEALPLVTNKPDEEAMHRIRIQQVMEEVPTLRRVLTGRYSGVLSTALSPDERFLAKGSYEGFSIRALGSAEELSLDFPGPAQEMRFTPDGRRLLVRASTDQGRATDTVLEKDSVAAVLDLESLQHGSFRHASGRRLTFDESIKSVFSPDGARLASATNDNAIEILELASELASADTIAALKGHSNVISMLAFSPDGSLLASASRDRTVRLWRVPSGEQVCPPIIHDGPVIRVVFSPDAELIATATEYTGEPRARAWINTWRVTTGERVGPPIIASATVDMLTFTPSTDYKLIASDAPNSFTIRDPEDHEPVFPRFQFDSRIRCWAFSPDAKQLAIGCKWERARVFDLDTGRPTTPILYHSSFVESLEFSPKGDILLSASNDRTMKFWELASPYKPTSAVVSGGLLTIPAASYPKAMNPEGNRLLVAIKSNLLHMIDVDKGTGIVLDEPCPGDALTNQLVFAPNDKAWAAANNQVGRVHLWKKNGSNTRMLSLEHPEPVQLLRFNSNNIALHSVSSDGVFRTWNADTGSLVSETRLPADYAIPMAISPDGQRVIYKPHMYRVPDGGIRQRLHIFSLQNNLTVSVRTNSWDDVHSVVFSPDGERFAIGCDSTGRIWDSLSGQPLTPEMRHGMKVFSLDWSNDGERLLMSGTADWATLWDTRTGEPVGNRMLMKGSVGQASLGGDNRFVVTPSADHSVRVWDADRTEPLTRRVQHLSTIRAVGMSKSNRLLTLSDPGVLLTWELRESTAPLQVIASYAKLVSGRKLGSDGLFVPLTPEELKELRYSLKDNELGLDTPDSGRR